MTMITKIITMSSLFVFDPQDFVRPPSNTIAIFGADDKAKAGYVRDFAIFPTGFQSVGTTVA